jgi:hypothetical protein
MNGAMIASPHKLFWVSELYQTFGKASQSLSSPSIVCSLRVEKSFSRDGRS